MDHKELVAGLPLHISKQLRNYRAEKLQNWTQQSSLLSCWCHWKNSSHEHSKENGLLLDCTIYSSYCSSKQNSQQNSHHRSQQTNWKNCGKQCRFSKVRSVVLRWKMWTTFAPIVLSHFLGNQESLRYHNTSDLILQQFNYQGCISLPLIEEVQDKLLVEASIFTKQDLKWVPVDTKDWKKTNFSPTPGMGS